MNCDLVQESILSGGNVSAEHMAECAACRELHASWGDLDARLSQWAAQGEPPADFVEKVLARTSARLSPEEIEVRRARVEAEHRAALERLSKLFSLRRRLRGINPGWLLDYFRGILPLKELAEAFIWGLVLFLVLSSQAAWPLPPSAAFGLSLGLTGFLFGLKHPRLLA